MSCQFQIPEATKQTTKVRPLVKVIWPNSKHYCTIRIVVVLVQPSSDFQTFITGKLLLN